MITLEKLAQIAAGNSDEALANALTKEASFNDREVYLDELAKQAYEEGWNTAVAEMEALAAENSIQVTAPEGNNATDSRSLNLIAQAPATGSAATNNLNDIPQTGTMVNDTNPVDPARTIADIAAAATANAPANAETGEMTPSEVTYVQNKAQQILTDAVQGGAMQTVTPTK